MDFKEILLVIRTNLAQMLDLLPEDKILAKKYLMTLEREWSNLPEEATYSDLCNDLLSFSELADFSDKDKTTTWWTACYDISIGTVEFFRVQDKLKTEEWKMARARGSNIPYSWRWSMT